MTNIEKLNLLQEIKNDIANSMQKINLLENELESEMHQTNPQNDDRDIARLEHYFGCKLKIYENINKLFENEYEKRFLVYYKNEMHLMRLFDTFPEINIRRESIVPCANVHDYLSTVTLLQMTQTLVEQQEDVAEQYGRKLSEREMIAKMMNLNIDSITEGYTLAPSDYMGGALHIKRIDELNMFESDKDATDQAIKDGVKIIHDLITDLSEDDDDFQYGYIDTPGNRDIIENHLKTRKMTVH